MKPKSKYTVKYTPDLKSGWWVAEVVDLPGCLTQGRTLEQARDRIREALEAYLDLPKPYAGELVDEVDLPQALREVVTAVAEAREASKRTAERARDAEWKAVYVLKKSKLNLSDAGILLGFSKQRAHQILKSSKASKAPPPRATPKRAAKRATG
jgi:predicted RNase H-like HicB family nuclease